MEKPTVEENKNTKCNLEKSKEQINQILQSQKINENNRKNILKINQYVIFERNIAFFCNFVV